MVRNRFDAQLEQLNVELITMGAFCEEAISSAIALIDDYHPEREKQVREKDSEIDHKEKEIESICLKLLLHQQPVAKDLRAVSAALKMISDMERIGDQASDIAEIAGYLQESGIKGKTEIKAMAQAAITMVNDSIDSFVKKDLDLARKVSESDDEVDEYFDRIKEELISLISDDNAMGGACLDLLMVAKYLERIGDHAVNIAEWVEYSITGVHINSELL